MTLEQLVVLEAIVECGGFRAASDKLFKAQSAVSYAIKHLEEELGVEIFTRRGYRPELTKEGISFYARAKALLTHAREVESYSKRVTQGIEPVFSLSCSSLFPIEVLTEKLEQLKKEFPQTDLQVRIDLGGGEDHLMSDEVDIAIVETTENVTQIEYIPTQQFAQMVLCVASFHELARLSELAPLKHEMDRSELLRFPQIVLNKTDKNTKKREEIVKGAKQWIVGDFQMKKELIKAGLGWGRIPAHFIKKELEEKQIVKLRVVGEESPEMPLYVARKKGLVHGSISNFIWNSFEPKRELKPRSAD